MRLSVPPCLMLLVALPVFAQTVPAAINYQGRLSDNTPQQNPLSATVAMQFAIYDAASGGTQLWQEPAGAATVAVPVVNGIFAVQLGGNGVAIPATVFSGGAARWLEIIANGETLAPRQAISATAYANQAENAASATSAVVFSDPLAGDVSGGQGATQVVKLQGQPVSAAAPAATQVLTYGAGQWGAADLPVSPLPAGCAAGQIAVSTGPGAWRCGLACGFGLADCDANIGNGCEITVINNPDNCGNCSQACSGTNIPSRLCAGGVCTGACAANFADCNSDKLTDGCETSTTTTANCAGCGNACDAVNSNGADCTGTTCTYTGCKAGFGDCATAAPDTNGCETPLNSIANCSNCGVACDTANSNGAACTGATCTYSSCKAGRLNCVTFAPDSNGCESSATSINSCGGCATACSLTNASAAACATGFTCTYTCKAGFADCDVGAPPDTNGCEINLTNDNNHCGNCATVCSGGRVCLNSLCKLLDGALCVADTDCINGHCLTAQASKRCTALAACPLCQVINGTGTACVNALAGTDPKAECAGKNCSGAGTCNP